jgi:hypothetical protein
LTRAIAGPPIERRRAGLPAARAGAERDRLVVEDKPIAREAGDGGLAAARRTREDPGATSVHHGGRVKKDPALLHQQEAAQKPEQIRVERRPRARTEGYTAPGQITVGA